MLKHIAAFEWRYQVKSPVFWIGCFVFFALTFGAVTADSIQIGARGNVNLNSPLAILQTQATMSIFAVFVMVAMVANVVVRDDETRFSAILRTTSITRENYLVGRFLGATAAAFGVMAVVPLAIAIGSLMPWLDPDKVGPFNLEHYLFSLFVFGLPTLLIVSSTLFALATATRSLMWTYVGAVGVVMLDLLLSGLLHEPRYDTVAALADPFGMSTLEIVTKYWTAADRNTQLPPLQGLLLGNRVVWLVLAAVLFVATLRLFQFEVRPRRTKFFAPEPSAEAPTPQTFNKLAFPRVDAETRRAQLWKLVRFDVAFVFRSPAFFALLGIGVLNSAGSLWFSGEIYGSAAWPVTRVMVQVLNASFGFLPTIIAILYAGELVWRDREQRMHEIVDATAAPDWTHLIPKILAIGLVLACSAGVAVLEGIATQLLKGFPDIEFPDYLLWFLLPTTINALLLAVLAVFVQVIAPQKYIGWGLMLLFIVANVSMSGAGVEHVMLHYAGTTPVPLSDMNGMGRFWKGAAWCQVYWAGFALVLSAVAHGLWRRGVQTALTPRISQLPNHLKGIPAVLLGLGLIVWTGAGAVIFWNTNILNSYLTQHDRDERLARFEKVLLPFERVVQPKIVSVALDVQLYPREARMEASGTYEVENRSGMPIDSLHVNWFKDHLSLDSLDFPGAKVLQDYPEFHYRVYALSPPLQPGEHRTLHFRTTLSENGFTNSAPLTGIVENGTFVDNSAFTPSFGVERNALLKDRAKRRKYGLPADLRPPKLEDEAARAFNPFRHDSDWVTVDIAVTTDADQLPIAPGQTVSDVTTNGRRRVHFKSDAPLANIFSVQSARYAVQRGHWNDVDLAVYYDHRHKYNVDRMLTAMKASLELYSTRFSPYQFHQARIVEFPAYANFAESFANTIPFSESVGFLFKLDDASKIDFVTYVTAHEVAHQWWGHQLLPADKQGASMLLESFSQYSALLVMEKMYGRDQVRRFTKYELDFYLRARGSEAVEELPLARVEDQPYIHYNKGSLAMYWLREAIGEQAVDHAMSNLLKEFAFKGPPYADTRDFIKLLRVEANPEQQQLITDLFQNITLYDVKVTGAVAHKRPDGKFNLSLDVTARKMYSDSTGKETDAPLNEMFEVGAFAVNPGDAKFSTSSVLDFESRKLVSGRQKVDLVVPQAPSFAGVDPYNKRIDRNSEDNLVKVELQ